MTFEANMFLYAALFLRRAEISTPEGFQCVSIFPEKQSSVKESYGLQVHTKLSIILKNKFPTKASVFFAYYPELVLSWGK